MTHERDIFKDNNNNNSNNNNHHLLLHALALASYRERSNERTRDHTSIACYSEAIASRSSAAASSMNACSILEGAIDAAAGPFIDESERVRESESEMASNDVHDEAVMIWRIVHT